MTRKKYPPEQISRITGLSGGFRQTGILTGQTGLLRVEGWEVNHPNIPERDPFGRSLSPPEPEASLRERDPFSGKGTPSGSGQAC